MFLTGGVGVVVYFRKEGRALGEVTKYVFRISATLFQDNDAPQLPDTSSTISASAAGTLPTDTSNPPK